MFLFLKAYIQLIRFDLYLSRNLFQRVHEIVRGCAVVIVEPHPRATEEICRSVDLASAWYWKQVPCLQRSAATVCLLRRYGISAELVIGAQQFPFRAHAWTEVDGKVVNDKPYVSDLYAILARC